MKINFIHEISQNVFSDFIYTDEIIWIFSILLIPKFNTDGRLRSNSTLARSNRTFRIVAFNFARSIRINFQKMRRVQNIAGDFSCRKKDGRGGDERRRTDSDSRNIRSDCSRDRCRGYYFSGDRNPAGAKSTEPNPGSLSNHKA